MRSFNHSTSFIIIIWIKLCLWKILFTMKKLKRVLIYFIQWKYSSMTLIWRIKQVKITMNLWKTFTMKRKSIFMKRLCKYFFINSITRKFYSTSIIKAFVNHSKYRSIQTKKRKIFTISILNRSRSMMTSNMSTKKRKIQSIIMTKIFTSWITRRAKLQINSS